MKFKSRREQCVPVICMWGPPSETYTVPSAIPWSTTEHKSVRMLMRARSPYSHSVRETLTARRKGEVEKIAEELNGKTHRRWCHHALVPSMFLSRGSLMSKIRFQDRFAVRCLELISCFAFPEEGIMKQMDLATTYDHCWIIKDCDILSLSN